MRLRSRGMTPTLISLTMDLPYDAIVEAMDRLDMPRKRKDRRVVIGSDVVMLRTPSPPRQFSWQT